MIRRFLPVYVLALIVPFFLSSCIDIDSTVTLTDKGSGTLDLIYRVSTIALQIGEANADGPTLPLPVAEADFRRSVLANPGLILESYTRTSEKEETVVSAKIGFSKIEDLNGFLGGGSPVFVLKNSGNQRSLEQQLLPGNPESLDEKTRQFFQSFFSNYALHYTVIVPGKITSANLQQSRINGSEAKLSIPILQAVEAKEPLIWKINY